MYKAAIFADDYLTLLEFTSRLEEELPVLEYSVFGEKSFEDSLKNSAEGYVITDFSKIREAEFLITLAQPANEVSEINGFDGTVIDACGLDFAAGTEVFHIPEPVRKTLRNIAVPIADVSVAVNLPVCVYGKAGVEELMRQTKDIFSFENSGSSVFERRIAFNQHFNPVSFGRLIENTAEDFIGSGGDISIRISPLSTVFVIDVFAKNHIGLKNGYGFFMTEGFFTASDVSERSDIAVIAGRNRLTFIGDYIRVFTEDMVNKLKEVIG